MSPNINLRPDVYQKIGQYGNRDESWNTVLQRILKHVDEEAALEDKNNRQTRDKSNNQSAVKEADPLSKLENGTPLRHRYQRGEYSGERTESEIQNGAVSYKGERLSPSKAAGKADTDIRGRDASAAHNGWRWWEYRTEDGEWKEIDNLR